MFTTGQWYLYLNIYSARRQSTTGFPGGNEPWDGMMQVLIILIQRTVSTDSSIMWCGWVSTSPDPESEDLELPPKGVGPAAEKYGRLGA